MTKTLFQNRLCAGRQLAGEINRLALENPTVLALANGGVVVGYEIAKKLRCPIEPIIAKKIFFPLENSLGFGAINDRGEVYLSKYAEGVPEEIIDYQTDLANEIIKKRKIIFSKYIKIDSLIGKTALLVDDSLATGSTMMATIKSIRRRNPKKIIIAATIASEEALDLLRREVDLIVTLYRHPKGSVKRISDVYRDYTRVNDKQVLYHLTQTSRSLAN